eukprot:jgi/Hompol1/386/HPOL_005306-RA
MGPTVFPDLDRKRVVSAEEVRMNLVAAAAEKMGRNQTVLRGKIEASGDGNTQQSQSQSQSQSQQQQQQSQQQQNDAGTAQNGTVSGGESSINQTVNGDADGLGDAENKPQGIGMSFDWENEQLADQQFVFSDTNTSPEANRVAA